MPNLRFLVLARNRIQKVENVIFLENLQYLDLSDNAIDELDVDELPDQALAYVSFVGNACAEKEQYRSQLVGHLPLLREIDGRAVTVSEKREFDLDGGVATDEDDDDEDDDSQQEEDEQEEAVKAEDRIKSAEEVREEIEDMYAAAFDRMRAKRDEMIIRAGAEKAAVDAEFAKRLKTVDEARAFLESVQQEQQKPAPPA
jgi:Leucine-rich repeat (LRR) protein